MTSSSTWSACRLLPGAFNEVADAETVKNVAQHMRCVHNEVLSNQWSLQNIPIDLQSSELIDVHLFLQSAQPHLFTELGALPSMFKTSAQLRLENLALRQQLTVLRRSATKRLKLTPADRIFWVWLHRVRADWTSALMIVKAETVVAWHRKGFRLFWTWKIHRGKADRPSVPPEVRDLIRMMSRNNPRWGAPRIHGELLKLGIEITEPTVAKYMVRHRKPPSQTWRTFLDNHVKSLVSVDFFTVPTIRFEILYVFLVHTTGGAFCTSA